MLKKTPSRNQRSKGIKVKHVLQILLLLGVCFWLGYQVKHSYDKKAALSEKGAKTLIRTETDSELLKLGRKDLPHNEVRTNVKHEQEEAVGEEEEKHELEDEKHEAEEREEGDPKHEVDDIEEEVQKHEGEEQEEEEEESKNEDAARDDEIDENDLEKKEEGADHEEEFVDEERERDDEGDEKDGDKNEDEEKEDRSENENPSDDQDNEGGNKNAHEAREEHYKGDDASSAVTHDAQVISAETEKLTVESLNGTSEKSEEDGNQHNFRLVGDTAASNGTISVVASEEKVEGNSSNPVTSSLLDANVKLQSSDPVEANNNSTIVSTEASNNLSEVNQETSSYQPNGTETVSGSANSQNVTVDGMTSQEGITGQILVMEQTQQNNNSVSGNDQSVSNIAGDKINSNMSEKILRSVGTAEVDDSSRSSTIKETTDATKNDELTSQDDTKPEESKNEDATANKETTTEDATKNEESTNEDASKKQDSTTEDSNKNVESKIQDSTETDKSNDTSESGGTDEGSESKNGTVNAVQNDPIDSSDSHISEEEKEARTDLGTLPEIQTEGDENGESAAE